MRRTETWNTYSQAQLEELEALAADYREFLDRGKTERECVREAVRLSKEKGYVSLAQVCAQEGTLSPGDKVYAVCMNKTVALFQIGRAPLEQGMRILGAHIDAPRLDVKQNPLYEDGGLAYLDTHYYGGVKKYQWVTVPLALHGVVVKKDGETADICIGEDAGDPVVFISDLLIHLAGEQMEKKARLVIEGENLDIVIGSRPAGAKDGGSPAGLCGEAEAGSKEKAGEADDGSKEEAWKVEDGLQGRSGEADDSREKAAKEAVKANILQILKEKYGIEEDDFLSAEIEAVPAGRARECGLDRSMILSYGQDDRACAYTSLRAQLQMDVPEKTCCCLLTDKEEIGSVGATGMESRFFENAVAELMDRAGQYSELKLRRCLRNSRMLSSDVSAAYDPLYASCFEKKNTAFLGRGIVLNKYTGSRGKSQCNDANAEYIARVRAIFEKHDVAFQTAELGKVDAGGGGTIAFLASRFGMEVIDSGVAVLSMHAPMEVTSKADLYEAYRGYKAFLEEA